MAFKRRAEQSFELTIVLELLQLSERCGDVAQILGPRVSRRSAVMRASRSTPHSFGAARLRLNGREQATIRQSVGQLVESRRPVLLPRPTEMKPCVNLACAQLECRCLALATRNHDIGPSDAEFRHSQFERLRRCFHQQVQQGQQGFLRIAVEGGAQSKLSRQLAKIANIAFEFRDLSLGNHLSGINRGNARLHTVVGGSGCEGGKQVGINPIRVDEADIAGSVAEADC